MLYGFMHGNNAVNERIHLSSSQQTGMCNGENDAKISSL